jgi:hypothetical protein
MKLRDKQEHKPNIKKKNEKRSLRAAKNGNLKELLKVIKILEYQQNTEWTASRQNTIASYCDLIRDIKAKKSKIEVVAGKKKRRNILKGGGKIKWSKKCSEFDVHAELYRRIKEVPLLIPRGEVYAYTDKGNACRFDIVVFRKDGPAHIPFCVIEVKKRGQDIGSKQKAKYESFGLPLFVCHGENGIDKVLGQVIKAPYPPVKPLDSHINKV